MNTSFRFLFLAFAILQATLAFGKESSITLSHVVVKMDADKWVGKELKVGDGKNKTAVLNNASEGLVVFVIDIVPAKPLKNDDPLATRTLASQMAKQKYTGFYSVAEKSDVTTIASSSISGGWTCMQSIAKRTPNAEDLFSTHCAAMDRGFEVYAILETRRPVTETGNSLFKTLLTSMSKK